MKLSILLIALLAFANSVCAQQFNFSGIWTRNSEQCDPGKLSINSIPVSVRVKQSSSTVEIERVSINRAGDTTRYKEVLRFDGFQVPSQVKPGLVKKAVIKWIDKGLDEQAVYEDEKGNIIQKGHEDWSLSEDKKTLSIKLLLTIGNQDYHLIEIFDKK